MHAQTAALLADWPKFARDFTERSASAFAWSRWPAEVIVLTVRWPLSHPLSAASVMELLAEQGIDVSTRAVLRWVQTFGPLLAADVRRHHRPLGTKCCVDEVFFFRGKDKRYLYRALDEHGQVVDVLFRERRDTDPVAAFFRQALARTGWRPAQVIGDHHQPYVKAVREVLPEAEHVWTGLHRARGETTRPIERSQVVVRDRLRAARLMRQPTVPVVTALSVYLTIPRGEASVASGCSVYVTQLTADSKASASRLSVAMPSRTDF